MVIVGWDAALVNNGLVTIIDNNGLTVAGAGIVTTAKNNSKGTFGNVDYINRGFEICEGVKQYIMDANANIVIVEVPTTGTQSKATAMAFGLVYGVIAGFLNDAQLSSIPFIFSQPIDTKNNVGGGKNASKDTIAKKVIEVLPDIEDYIGCTNKVRREHIYDAAGAVLANMNDPIYKAVKNAET